MEHGVWGMGHGERSGVPTTLSGGYGIGKCDFFTTAEDTGGNRDKDSETERLRD
jgi:hypothetical protein